MRRRSGGDRPVDDGTPLADRAMRPAGTPARFAGTSELLLAEDDPPEIGPPAANGGLVYSYSRVEEQWDIRLRPDGSARASVVVRRERQVSSDRRWRFVARRELPQQADIRRSRLAIGLSCAAALMAGIAAVGAWWAANRPVPRDTLVLSLPPAPPQAPPVAILPPRGEASSARPIIAAPPPRRDAQADAGPAAPRAPKPLLYPAAPAPARTEASKPFAPDIPLERRPAVRAAMARAFASGEAEAWREDGLSGFVVVGPAEMEGAAACRNTVILARGGEDGDRTVSRRRCSPD